MLWEELLEDFNFAASMEKGLPAPVLDVLQLAGRLAVERGEQAYLVGGAIRDLLLGRSSPDVDVVTEGKALELAPLLAANGGALVATHSRFGTAEVHFKEWCLDLITARKETYAHPGALPHVTPGTIMDDLKRRDFSVNAMAAHLCPGHYGQFFDPHQGRQDLELRQIRVLHSESFREDATRMLRALRYDVRLGFHLEEETERLMRRDASMLDTISGDRLRHELMLILEEGCPEAVLRRAGEMGLLQQLHPSLRGNDNLAVLFHRARELDISASGRTAVYLCLMVLSLKEKEVEQLVERLKFPKETARNMQDAARLWAEIGRLEVPRLLPSAVYRFLEGYSHQSVMACSLAAPPLIVERLKNYLDKLHLIRPALKGDDLIKLGVPASPEVGKILEQLRDARLDGRVKSRAEEEALVQEWLEFQKAGPL